ncbi:hypothetical protein IWW39_005529 [Coemansia spiralis]|uniref:Thiol methyltransferase 1 n=1 Tax=Coemansia spiralis TaxID=417178 RepID=A0A9W8GED0_9FUNG|nr:hypothetical protein IWW39_005529 [Coemansia spiralis]
MMAVSLEGPLSSVVAPKITSSTVVSTVAAVQIRSAQTDRTSSGHKQEWDAYWANGGHEYDQRGPSVALQELLEVHRWLLPRGRCLVAGCGSGYDALYLAKRGLPHVLGIDFCEPAIARAHKLVEAAGGASALAGKLSFAVENFITFKPLHRFTVAYEYGLFSAIAPSQRQQWADAYARLIVPQGSLIVVLFPLIHRGPSPPYQVSMAECEQYLKRYFVLLRVDPNCRCIEGQEGNELVSVWKRL